MPMQAEVTSTATSAAATRSAGRNLRRRGDEHGADDGAEEDPQRASDADGGPDLVVDLLLQALEELGSSAMASASSGRSSSTRRSRPERARRGSPARCEPRGGRCTSVPPSRSGRAEKVASNGPISACVEPNSATPIVAPTRARTVVSRRSTSRRRSGSGPSADPEEGSRRLLGDGPSDLLVGLPRYGPPWAPPPAPVRRSSTLAVGGLLVQRSMPGVRAG